MSSLVDLSRPVLALDASAETAAACLLAVSGEPLVREAEEGQRAGTALHALIAGLLEDAGMSVGALGGIVAIRGPGSFTGLRVALAAAQGLGLAADLPTRGVETTAAVAWASGRSGRIAVLLDGGQGRLFTAVHERFERSLIERSAVSDRSPEDALAWLANEAPDHALFRGRPAALERSREFGAVAFEKPLPAAAAELALRNLACGPAEPLYLRAPAIRPRPS